MLTGESVVPADLDQVYFSYLSQHDPADPDGDPNTSDYGPDYYALFIMKVGQQVSGEWSFLSLAIEPNSISLYKWENDDATLIGTYPFTSTKDVWHDVQVVFSGTNNEHVEVWHGLRGGGYTKIVDASTGLTNTDTNVAFAIGEEGGYLFDNLRIQADSIYAESMEQEYLYDVLGRRVARTTYENYVPKTTYYAYDGDKVIEELDGDGNVIASFVYGNYVDEVLEMRRDTTGDGTLDTTYYYLQDDLYNVLALTDEGGDIVERYEYGDYGYPTVFDSNNIETGNVSAYGNPYLFTGRRWDADTELYWYRTRYMDPALGRFISRDQIGLWGDANNLGNPFAYAGNNPWTNLDPYGQYGANPWHSAYLEQQMKYGGPTLIDLSDPVVQGYIGAGGAVLEIGGGISFGTAGSATGVGAPVAVGAATVIVAHGVDSFWANVQQIRTGCHVKTVTEEVATYYSGSETFGRYFDMSVGFLDFGVGAFGVLARSGKLAGVVDDALEVGVKSLDDVPSRGADWFDEVAHNATRNPDSDTLVLGHYAEEGTSYEKFAKGYGDGATYFQLDNWNAVTKGLTRKEIWRINRTFLKKQLSQGKKILFSHDPLKARPGSYFESEVGYLKKFGYSFVQKNEWTWEAVK